jgi:hypothetical protein
MRLPRTLALGTGIAIVAVSAAFITSSAAAAPEAGVVFVTAVGGNLDSGWTATQSPTSQHSGLMFSDVSAFTVRNSLDAAVPVAASFLEAFAADVVFANNNDTSLTGVIELTRDSGTGGLVTLTALNPGKRSWMSTLLQWQTDVAFGNFEANHIDTLRAFGSAPGTGTIITAAGFDSDGSDLVMTSAIVNDQKYLFTPAPERGHPFTNSPITPAAFATDGFTVTTNGFLPDETLDLRLGFDTAWGTDDTRLAEGANANDSGAVTYTWTWTGVALPGDYRITLHSTDGTRLQFFEFEVVDSLPSTGAEPLGLIYASGALGLVGTAIVVTGAIRRKNSTTAARNPATEKAF